MLITPALGPMSGKLGGIVASHNRSGAYFRRKSIPTNPGSTRQNDARSALSNSSGDWAGLTNAQRAGWNAYAATMPLINRLGETFYLTGHQTYIRTNTSRARCLQTAIPDSPVVDGECPPCSGLQAASVITDSASAVANSLTVTLAALGTFDPSATGFLAQFWTSLPMSLGRVFPALPWKWLGYVLGDSTTPPTSGVFAMGFGNLSTSMRFSIMCRLTDPTGRVSPKIRCLESVVNVP